MKLYESNELAVLVPQSERIAADGKGESHRPLQGGPFITVTLEELRECFHAGAFSEEDTKGPDECFKEFLQTQGINP